MATDNPLTDRRTLLKTAGAATVGTILAGCSSGDQSTQSDDGENDDSQGGDDGGSSTESFDGWMDNVGNYDGVTDRTGKNEVTIDVGAKGNDGNLAFDPAAVRVSSGTTVTWKWTGKGGSHNVTAKDGNFESKLMSEKGKTFEQTFDSSGTHKYKCNPHEAMGMKGVVVVE